MIGSEKRGTKPKNKAGSQSTMAFRFVRFVSFRFVSFVFVPSATAFPGSQSTITHLDDVYDKMGRKRLKKLLFLAVLYRRRRRRLCTSNRRFWVRQIFTKRREQGEFHNLIQEMRLVDPESHFRYLRMSKYTFDDLLRKVVFKFYIIYNHFCIKYPSGCSYVEAQDL